MSTLSTPIRRTRTLVLGALLALGACQSGTSGTSTAPSGTTSDRAELSNEFTANATVAAVQRADRIVTLRREDGTQFDVKAGDAVRNFDQIEVGDVLRVRYRETLSATRGGATGGLRPSSGAVAAASAQPGDKPGVGIGMSIQLNVRIESIDLARDIVVFSLDSGELVAHRLATPEGREFARGLMIGDTVQLDYAQALALSIEEL